MPARADQSDPTERRVWRILLWRRVQGTGGLMLACCFFLPTVKACNSKIYPVQEVWADVSRWPPSLAELAGSFLWFVAPYLFGLLTFIVAVRGYRLRREADRTLGISVAVLLGGVIVIVLVGLALELAAMIRSGGGLGWELGSAVFIALVLTSAAYWLRGLHMGPAGLLSMRWYAAVLCVLWFGNWLVTDPRDTLFGLWLSLAGSAAIIAGAFGEAKARTGRTSRRTLAALFTCRLKLFDVDGPRCKKCEYLLIGLTTPRCPECGQPFTWRDCGPLLAPPPGHPGSQAG